MMSEIIRIKNYPVNNCYLCNSEMDIQAFGGYCPECKLYGLDFVCDEVRITFPEVQCFVIESKDIRFLDQGKTYILPTAEIITKDNYIQLFEKAKKLSVFT